MANEASKHLTNVNQIDGIYCASVEHPEAGTGCTVILCPAGATGGVDVRGGAPATRETDLLRPEETVQQLHAVVLSGGSAYGLAASSGVADELERHGIGLDVGVGVVPIVSGACLFDLPVGDPAMRPTPDDGAQAVRAALAAYDGGAAGKEPLRSGNVGAGCGCTVGKMAGPTRAMKSGLGQDVEQLGELACGAVAAVNAAGSVWDPDAGAWVAGTLTEDGTAVADSVEEFISNVKTSIFARTNTTISCVVTNARLTKPEATKVAQMSADAYAHAIKPTHTTNDGDAIFVMATGEVDAPVDAVGMLATRALERAIVDGARSAAPAFGLKAARDLVH